MGIVDKIFSYKIYAKDDVAVRLIVLFGIKIKFTIYKPLFNEKVCRHLGFKTLLFIRDDGIGDFILDMPYMKYLKTSKKYNGYKLILAGTPAIIELAQKYLDNYIDEYMVLDFKNLKSLRKFAKKLSFSTLINPIDAKVNSVANTLANLVRAKEKICHKGFFSRYDIRKFGKRITKVINNYTEVIDTGDEIMLVRDRCKLFFEKLLGEKLPAAKLLCDLQNSEPDISSEYVIVSPFSRSNLRTYSQENFAKIIDYLTERIKLPVIIVGSRGEIKKAQEIKELCKNLNLVYNQAGKFSLSESIQYIKHAKLLVANETGTVHIAQNYRVNTICISNGSYMNTFQPYPKEESYITYVYPDNIYEYIAKNNNEGYEMEYDINNINPKKVINAIEEVLEQENTKSNKDFCLL